MDISYGQVYKSLRKNKNKTLEDVANENISKSFLSKFERGKSDISFSRMTYILKAINVSLSEFQHLMEEGKDLDDIETYLIEISTFYYLKDIKALRKNVDEEKKKYKITGKVEYLHKYILALAFICDIEQKKLPEKENEILSNYLFDIEYWGKYEFVLLSNTISVINLNTATILADELIKKDHLYGSTSDDMELKLSIILNLIMNCLTEGKVKLAKKYINTVEEYNLVDKFIYYKIVLNVYKILSNTNKENLSNSKEEISNILTFLDYIGSSELSPMIDDISKKYFCTL